MRASRGLDARVGLRPPKYGRWHEGCTCVRASKGLDARVDRGLPENGRRHGVHLPAREPGARHAGRHAPSQIWQVTEGNSQPRQPPPWALPLLDTVSRQCAMRQRGSLELFQAFDTDGFIR